jgi:hypothetical protein
VDLIVEKKIQEISDTIKSRVYDLKKNIDKIAEELTNEAKDITNRIKE